MKNIQLVVLALSSALVVAAPSAGASDPKLPVQIIGNVELGPFGNGTGIPPVPSNPLQCINSGTEHDGGFDSQTPGTVDPYVSTTGGATGVRVGIVFYTDDPHGGPLTTGYFYVEYVPSQPCGL